MSSFIGSSSALMQLGMWRGLCLCLIGLISSSVKTMSWSDTHGKTSTLNTLFGRLVKIKARILSFRVGSTTICTRLMLSVISENL